MSIEVGQLVLPDWFVTNNSFDPITECIDKKKWVRKIAVVLIWLNMEIISLFTTEKTISRAVVSTGFDILGEYGHKVGELSCMCVIIQYLMCQLVNYRTYRSSNQQTIKLLQSLRSENAQTDWNRIFYLVDVIEISFLVGLSVYSTYVLHGPIWWLMIYKLITGLIAGHSASISVKILIANCLFLNKTCRNLTDDISKLSEKLVIDGKNGKTRKLSVTTVCAEFQSICVKFHVQNHYFRKIIFIIMSTTIPIVSGGIFIISELKATVIVSLVGNVAVLNVMAASSMVILTSAKVEAKMRKCYPLICQLLCHRSMNWSLRLKLLRLIEQFDNQISFTSFDTNKLDYMDYVEVRLCNHVMFFINLTTMFHS